MNLYLGNEVYLSENIMHLLNENKIAKINNSKYMLFEFMINVKPINVYDIIYEDIEVPDLKEFKYSFKEKMIMGLKNKYYRI